MRKNTGQARGEGRERERVDERTRSKLFIVPFPNRVSWQQSQSVTQPRDGTHMAERGIEPAIPRSPGIRFLPELKLPHKYNKLNLTGRKGHQQIQIKQGWGENREIATLSTHHSIKVELKIIRIEVELIFRNQAN